MSSDILVGIAIALIMLIIVCVMYSCLTVVDNVEMEEQIHENASKPKPKQEPKNIHPDMGRKVHIYANPFYEGLLHTAYEGKLPLYYDFGATSSIISHDNHIKIGEAGSDNVGSIDSGSMSIRIEMIAPSGDLIKTANCTGKVPHVFGNGGIFEDSVRFAVRGGKMKIIKIE